MILESLRRNAARKSNLDADKETMTQAAVEIVRLRAALEEVRSGDWTTMMELRAIVDRALAETR